MKRHLYGKHGSILGSGARRALQALLTGAALAALVGMPVWFFFLGL